MNIKRTRSISKNIANGMRMKTGKGSSFLAKQAVYRCIAPMVNQNFTTYVTQSKIAEITGLSIPTVQRTISALRKEGKLFTTHIYGYSEMLGKRIRTGTAIILTAIRSAVRDLHITKIPQIPYSPHETGNTKAVERQIIWMNNKTGEIIKQHTEILEFAA